MKILSTLLFVITATIACSCNDASTSPKGTTNFPTYKHSLKGKISNPKNITIPDNAYLSIGWKVPIGDYNYFYGEGYIDKSTNTFTIGFNDDLPTQAFNKNDSSLDGLGVASVALITSATKFEGKYTEKIPETDYKIYGAMNYSGLVYIAGEPSKVEFRSWATVFQKGYNFAKGVEGPARGQDYFEPVGTKEMVLIIDTSAASFKMPDWD